MERGIIRRLDDLGRIVVPKEYRRMLKIELGDPLEIFTVDNGDIVLRRFDMSAAVKNEGLLAAEALENETGRTVVVSDKEKFVSGYGLDKERVVGKYLPEAVRSKLNFLGPLSTSTFNDLMGIGLKDTGFDYLAMAPIVNNNAGYGVLAMFANEPIGDEELRLLKITAQMIAINLQRY